MRIAISFALVITLSIIAAPLQVYGTDYTPFHVTGPTITSTHGNVLSRSGGGQQLIIEYTLKNLESQPFEKPVVAITEIRDRDGFTLYLALQTIDLAPDETGTVGASWLVPHDAQVDDVYRINFFMITSLEMPGALGALVDGEIRIDSTMPYVIVQIFQ